MTWADFYLVCFVVGFFLSVVMFLAGGLQFPHMHIHMPGFQGHGFHGHGFHGHGFHHHGAGAYGAPTSHSASGGDISPFNLITLTTFLAWFGGTGYLLSRHSSMWYMAALGVSLLSGTGGAAIIYLFLSRVLSSPEESLDPADFEMVGVLGKLSVRISEGGTGELIYSQAGTRRVCGARSDDGSAILKGTEVVVTRYERGIAYVRRWTELAGEDTEFGQASETKVSKEARPQ
jgi:membrane protein implicated in regulation of membrane protease activity